jgi:SET domain-containing protein
MKLLATPGLEVQKSAISGRGCFATSAFAKGRKIGELIGERISRAEAKRRTEGKRIIRCVEIDYYWRIDSRRIGNAFAFVNHSCQPNTRVVIRYGRVEFYALRPIASGEELTLDYEKSQHSDTKRCTCGAPNCRGTINKI